MKRMTHNQKCLILVVVALLAASIACDDPPQAKDPPVVAAGAVAGTGQTLSALYRAVLGAPGTMIFQSGNSYIVAWQSGTKYAVYGLGQVSQDLLSANSARMNVEKLSIALNKGGWESIPPSALPALIVEQVLAAAASISNGILPTPVLYVPCPDCIPQSEEIEG